MDEPRTSLIGLNTAELSELAVKLGESAYRGKQLASRLYQKYDSTFDAMAELPKPFRDKLELESIITPIQVASHQISSDGVEKLLVHNGDHQVYECVLLPYEDRVSCCLSTQVGCPMGCTFCATGLSGFDRNLSVGEIVAQYIVLQNLSPRRISHVVFMGMGEPLLNFDNLIKAISIFHDEIGLSHRHLTVSTVGLVPQIDALAKLDLPINLALSLHSPLDEVRDKIMPVNHKWPVYTVVQTMRKYQKKTGRKVTFEYLMIDELNDSRAQAIALAALVKGFPCVVNLIPFNWVDTGQGFKRPRRDRVHAFRAELEKRGITVTERIERGHDIAAACGQLAGQHTGKFAKRSSLSALPVIS